MRWAVEYEQVIAIRRVPLPVDLIEETMTDPTFSGAATAESPVYWTGAGTPLERLVGQRRTPADRAVYKQDGKWFIEGLNDADAQKVIDSWRRPDGTIYPGEG